MFSAPEGSSGHLRPGLEFRQYPNRRSRMRMIFLLNLLLVLISLENIEVLLARSLFAMLLVRGCGQQGCLSMSIGVFR